MTKATYDKATHILKVIQEVERELKIWENELTNKHKMGYQQGWNNNHAAKLDSHVNSELFQGFRQQAIDNLKLYLIDLNKQFDEL